MSDFVADLVSEPDYEIILKRLFALNPGEWIPVSSLCEQQDTVTKRLSTLKARAGDKLYSAWMNFPGSVYGTGYSTIMFFVESLHWHSLAVYNLARLDESHA